MLQPDRPKILVGFEAARISTWTNFDVDKYRRGHGMSGPPLGAHRGDDRN